MPADAKAVRHLKRSSLAALTQAAVAMLELQGVLPITQTAQGAAAVYTAAFSTAAMVLRNALEGCRQVAWAGARSGTAGRICAPKGV